jgi:glyoxylase-like metal-dependent hydrolase (beta-lactamase superfamily II)
MKNKFKVWNSKSGYSISCILPGRSNVFLLSSGTKNILIDTSPGYKWKKLKARLEALGIKKLDYLILTHTHYDHAENASKIKTEFDAKVIGHSPGSQSVIIDDEICLTGDAMFGIFPGSIFPPFADNEYDMIKSWGKLLHTGCSIFLPSHGTANKVELVKKEYEKYILL